MNTKWLFCAGMRRSGSTWQYLTAKSLLPDAYHLGFVAHNEFEHFFNILDGNEGVVIVKTHVKPEKLEELLCIHKRYVLMCERNIQEVIASSIRAFGEDRLPADRIQNEASVILKEFGWWKDNSDSDLSLYQKYTAIENSPENCRSGIARFLRYHEFPEVDDQANLITRESVSNIGELRDKSGRVVVHKNHISQDVGLTDDRMWAIANIYGYQSMQSRARF